MPRIFRHMAQRMLILFLLLGGMGLVCQEAQAAKEARAMWDANTKTLTFYYGEQKSGGTTHYSGTQITATGSTFPAWNNNSSIYSNITTVVFESSFASVRPTSCQSWFRGMPKLTTITGLKNFNTTNVTTMAYMFCLSTALTSLDLSSFNTANVTTMAYMFSGCSGLTSLNLSSFNTAKVTNMTSMFYDCSNLRTICVNESGWSTAAVLYGSAMFYSCTKLVGGNGTVFNSSYTDQTRACIDKPGQAGYLTCATVSGTCGASGSSIIWYIDCDGVLNIKGTGAMNNYPALNMPWKSHRASITSVVISDGVTSIGYNAFNGCSNLTSVTIPPSVTSIEQNAFYGCYAMESLYITDLAAWCNVEFGVSVEATPFMRNNYNSGSTEYLGGGNLYLNGTLVTTLTIPDGITEIKNLTFFGCSSITSIDFNQVTTIGSASFKGCHGLTSVTLPEGVTSLKNAFPYCTQLQSISIPASLTSLTTQTLYHSDALTDIYVYWTDNIPGWPEYFTAQSPQPSITLHVPCGTEELYNTKANWKKYTIEGEGTNTVTVQAEDPTMGDVSIMVNP